MNTVYRFRGFVLGALAVLLWLFPHEEGFVPASAAVLALLGIFVRVEARRVIGEHSRGNQMAAPELSTAGIYSQIRHPLYLSNLCLGVAFALFHLGWRPATFGFAALLLIFEFSLARAEDAFLQKKFGGNFEKWKRTVPAFFPKFHSANAAPVQKRSIWKTLVADRWTWFWLLIYTLLLWLRRHLDLPFALL